MSSLFKRETAIISLVPNEDHTGKEGYAVKASAGLAALCTADTDPVIGVILDGETTSGLSSIAICDAAGGTVRVKLDAGSAAVNMGDLLTITATGTFNGKVVGKTLCARALQAGAAGELIEAALFHPITA